MESSEIIAVLQREFLAKNTAENRVKRLESDVIDLTNMNAGLERQLEKACNELNKRQVYFICHYIGLVVIIFIAYWLGGYVDG